ncbi:pilus assembly PilX N-terminal domain-containing protein [Thermoanaerobacterium sp. R66]|jgi:hypothetical protein|uniref:pilus assembly PilX N-terminal domain-containing protein n=1 Tax=Thermoanaerobacterium sp. R66 TaxID=2742479 RepID=UPI002380A65E|nr:pilus assembly PilX N-terminal domain-containing protein [Thermoanaerobacterium sp. R66]MDE4541676.1 pilus assembly PilX N-terminal domain-containing protein [Thermoanaerobacterium sp. R66]
MDDKGSALVFTLIIILIMSVLALSILDISLFEYKASYAYGNSIVVNNAAEAGLDTAKGVFNKSLFDNLNSLINNTANALINEYNSLIPPQTVPREVMYEAIYQAVRQYLENNVFNVYQNYQFYLDDKNTIAVTILYIKITDLQPFDGTNILPKYTIRIETIGTFKNLKRYGHALIVLDLNKSGNPISISSWVIDNTPPSN